MFLKEERKKRKFYSISGRGSRRILLWSFLAASFGMIYVGLSGWNLQVRAAGSTMALPTAGISYTLAPSDNRTSVKDVEDYMAVRRQVSARRAVKENVGGGILTSPKAENATISRISETSQSEFQRMQASTSVNHTAVVIEQAAVDNGVSIDDTYSRDVVQINEALSSSEEGTSVADAAVAAATRKELELEAAEAGMTVEEYTRSQEGTGSYMGQAKEAADSEELCVAMVSDFVNIRSNASTDSEIVGKLYANGVGTVLEPENEMGWMKIRSGNAVGYIKAEYVATGSYAHQLASEVQEYKATIRTETLRVRAAPDLDSDVITLIGQGDELTILEETDNGWLKVDTADGEGYISADYADVDVEYPEAKTTEEIAKETAEAKKAEEEKIKAQKAQKAAEEAKKKAEAARKAAEAAQTAEAQQAAEAAQRAAEAAANEATAAQESADAAAKAAAEAEAAGTSGSGKGQEVVNYAMQFIGNPYVWGGSSLTNGTDCSGFTMSVYAHFGVSLPHYDASQRSCGTAVGSLAEARPGDLICYSGHVGIYIGGGQIVHASNPRTGITVGTATYRNIVAIRRIFQ